MNLFLFSSSCKQAASSSACYPPLSSCGPSEWLIETTNVSNAVHTRRQTTMKHQMWLCGSNLNQDSVIVFRCFCFVKFTSRPAFYFRIGNRPRTTAALKRLGLIVCVTQWGSVKLQMPLLIQLSVWSWLFICIRTLLPSSVCLPFCLFFPSLSLYICYVMLLFALTVCRWNDKTAHHPSTLKWWI